MHPLLKSKHYLQLSTNQLNTNEKADLVTAISEKVSGVQKVDVLVTPEAFFKSKEFPVGGRKCVHRGFGSFIIKKRAQKIGRHIKKMAIVIPAHYIPSFKPAKTFVDQVKENVPVEEEVGA